MLIKKKISYFFCKGPVQRLDNTTLTSEAEYSINFTKPGKKFYLSLHYNGSISDMSMIVT